MTERPRWRSRSIRLVLVGATSALTAGCSGKVRDEYKSFADCSLDRGTACASDGCATSRGTYLGPRYVPMTGGSATSTRINVVREGFGNSCRRSSSRTGWGWG